MCGNAFESRVMGGHSNPRQFDPRRPANAPPTKGGRLPPQRSRHKGRRSQRGPCEAVKEPQFAKAAWWTYILQKTEHTDRRSQRGQCEDKYQHQGDPNQHQPSIRHHLCPERLTTYSSSSGGSGNSSSSILFIQIESLPYPGISRSRRSGDTDATRPYLGRHHRFRIQR